MAIEHFDAAPDHPYSRAVRAGDWLYLSGQASTDPVSKEIVPGDFREEFARTEANLRRVLGSAGAAVEHIVKITAILSDAQDLSLYNELYLAAFAHPRPARTTIISPLKRVKVELECVAYLGD